MYVVSMVYVIERHSVHTSVCDSPCRARIVECCKEDFTPKMGVRGFVYHFVEQTTGSGKCCDCEGLPIRGEEGKNVLDKFDWDCEKEWSHRHDEGTMRVWSRWGRLGAR